jgi:hypothetical protein
MCSMLNVRYFPTFNYVGVMSLRLHLLPYDVCMMMDLFVTITNHFP